MDRQKQASPATPGPTSVGRLRSALDLTSRQLLLAKGRSGMTDTATELSRSATLWELITRRAALTPDTTVLVEAAETPRADASTDRRLRPSRSCATAPNASPRACTGWAYAPARSSPGSSPPASRPCCSRSPSPGSAPSSPPSSPSTGTARSASRSASPRPSTSPSPAPGAGTTTPRWPPGSARGACSRRTGPCPTATRPYSRRRPPPARTSGGSTGPPAPPPTPRASCTPTAP